MLCGRPNAGKSSLMNALLEEERAIVTDVPGTTRDTLTESVQLNGVRVSLTDTAGLRETGDAVERIGVERAKKALTGADVRLLVMDGSQPFTDEDRQTLMGLEPHAVVLTKGDLGAVVDEGEVEAAFPMAKRIVVCAITGEGMESLKQLIASFAPEEDGESSALSQARHAQAALRACGSLDDAMRAIDDGMPLDVCAVDLAAALDCLGEITGETMSEEVISRVFERFCVGK